MYPPLIDWTRRYERQWPSFDDFRELIRNLPGPDLGAEAAVRAREATLTKPAGSLGQLEEIVAWLAAWTGKSVPQINRPLVAVFAGNHGVTAKNITPFPSSVTAQMVENFAAGGAAINQICIAHDLGLKVFDLALEHPTADITEEAAMDERTCAATMAFGMEGIAGGTDLLCIGEMGIGNTTIAAAIALALFGGTAEDWVGPGTGSTGDLWNVSLRRFVPLSSFIRHILRIRWKFCGVWADVRSLPWQVQFSPRVWRKFRLSLMAL